MRLRLDMCDVDFQLKIKDWHAYTSSFLDDDLWTHDEFLLKGKYIDYSFDSEVLLSSEVVYLRNALDALLRGIIKEKTEISFAEPDFIFKLSPAQRLFDEPGKVVYRDGYKDVDINMEMIVQFWCSGGLGANYFSMLFDRNDIEALYLYLCAETGEIAIDDVRIVKLLDAGVLLPE
ncbi:MAG: hypothetical protein IJS31_02960 [Oscillospiraceae bacterium]|nr:hypothetical protein [Oscillospiraceae bacterium]